MADHDFDSTRLAASAVGFWLMAYQVVGAESSGLTLVRLSAFEDCWPTVSF